MNDAQNIHKQAELSKYTIDNVISYLQDNCEDKVWLDVAVTDLRNIKARQSEIMDRAKNIIDIYYTNKEVPLITKEGVQDAG